MLGVEALNEPWQFTPLDVLKAFYWDSYWAVRAAAPRWLFVIQDSFRLDAWGDYMAGCGGVALDTHVYQAWFDIRPQNGFLDNACSWRQRLQKVQATGLPVLIGEWSLATDNCNMWLNVRIRTRLSDPHRGRPTHRLLTPRSCPRTGLSRQRAGLPQSRLRRHGVPPALRARHRRPADGRGARAARLDR